MPSRVAFPHKCRISCLRPPTANSDMEDEDGELTCRSNHSYHKLPSHLLKLSILKLDGSVFGKAMVFVSLKHKDYKRVCCNDLSGEFPDKELTLKGKLLDVVIEKNASVRDLKHAIEDVFISSSDEGQGKISWSHVWGHFCLCFGDQKLLNDRTYILTLGIKDGDQLEFVHHLSVNYSPRKRRAKNPNGSSIQQPRRSSSSTFSGAKNYEETTVESGAYEEDIFVFYNHEDDEIQASEFRLSQMVRGWLPSSRNRPSRFGMHCLGGGGPGMVRL